MTRWALVVVLAAGILATAREPAAAAGFAVDAHGSVFARGYSFAVLFHDGGEEDLIVQRTFAGTEGPVAWIAALPGRPTVSRAATAELNAVSRLATGRPLADGVPWGRCGDWNVIYIAMPADSTSGVSVIEPVPGGIGVVEAWFERNKFPLPDRVVAACRDHLNRGHRLVLARVDFVPGKSHAGPEPMISAGPLRFRFRSPEPVYPFGPGPGSAHLGLTLYAITRQPCTAPADTPGSWAATFSRPGPLPASLAEAHPRSADGTFWISQIFADLDSVPTAPQPLVPYDPLPVPEEGPISRRLQSIECLGWLGRRDGVRPLLDLLDRTDPERADAADAIVALGRIGDRAALPRLLELAGGEDWTVRRTAIYALGLMGAPEAVPLYIRGLSRVWHPPQERLPNGVHVVHESGGLDPADLERTLCVRLLQEHGDSNSLPPLRRMLTDPGEGGGTEATRPGPIRSAVLSALAGLGDAEATGEVYDNLIFGSQVMGPSTAADRRRFDFQGILGPILHGGYPARWSSLRDLERRFEGAPEVRERLLRRASRDPAVPVAGRALLVTRLFALDRLEAADRVNLEDLLRRALAGPDTVTVTDRQGADEVEVTLDPDACAAVYATARLGRTDRLLALWRSRAGRRPDLRGELACALAVTGAPRVLPAILEVVRRDWDAAARTPEFAARMADNAGRSPAERVFALRAVDLERRSRALRGFLVRIAGPETIRGLVEDRTLHPYSRLLWATELAGADRSAYGAADPLGDGQALLERIATGARSLPGGPELLETARSLFRGTLSVGG